MPLYEFECKRHGRFERSLPVARRRRARCPHCRSFGKRVISRVHITSIVTAHMNAGERGGAYVVSDQVVRGWGFDAKHVHTPAREQQLVEQGRRIGIPHKPVPDLAHQLRMGENDAGPV